MFALAELRTKMYWTKKVWSPFRLSHGGCGRTFLDKLLILHTRIDMEYPPTYKRRRTA